MQSSISLGRVRRNSRGERNLDRRNTEIKIPAPFNRSFADLRDS